MSYRHAADVADDVCKLIGKFTNYIYQIVLTRDGVIVKVGNTANKQAAVVNVTLHRNPNNSLLQDKVLAVVIAYRLRKYLRTTKI
jgi:hypothetical protein